MVNGLKPLRERTLTGTISRISHGNGIIDDDIYFTMSSCCHGYRPAVGDSVNVVCVECTHQRHNWRAYSIQPNKQDIETRFDINALSFHDLDVAVYVHFHLLSGQYQDPFPCLPFHS